MAISQIRPLKSYGSRMLFLNAPGPLPMSILPRYIDDYPFFSQRNLRRRGSDGSWEVFGVPAEWSQEEVADLYAEFIGSLHRDYMSRKDTRSPITWGVEGGLG